MTRRHHALSVTAAFLFAICLALPAAEPEPKLPDLLNKMPAQSVAEGQRISAEIVRLGPAAIKEICKRLKPPGKGDDAKARFALNGLTYYVCRPGAEAERKTFAGILIGSLEAATDREVKAFFIRQLQLAGKNEAVGPLSKHLTDEQLCEPATQALVRIRTPNAIKALAEALPAVKNANRATIIQALGTLRVKGSAKAIAKHADDENRETRLAALHALANIGDPSAASILAKAAQAKSPYERSQATRLYLLLARRLAEAGEKEECARICRDLTRTRTDPRESNVPCTALRMLVQALGRDALGDLLTAADSQSTQVRHAALKLGQAIPGEEVTHEWVAKAKQASPRIRADILAMLGRRGDRAALSAVLEALKDKEKPVRLAAIPSAVRLGGNDAAAPLLAAFKTDQRDEIRALKAAVMRLGGETVMPVVAAALPKVSVRSRVALLEVLAARRAKAQVKAAFAATGDKDSSVRVAALKALGDLADEKHLPKLIELLLNAKPGREQSAAQKTVVVVSEEIEDPERRAEPVLSAMAKTTGNQRGVLLKAAARIGGKKALETVLADMSSVDAKTQDAAVRALADWRDESAAADLLVIACGSKNPLHQVLALRGYVRVVGDAVKLSDAQKVRMLKDALAASKRAAEKKSVLARLADVRTIESLKLAAPCLDYDALKREAAAAVIKIACPKPEPRRRRSRKKKPEDKGLVGKEVVAALKKAIPLCTDAKARERAQEHLDTIPQPNAVNLAQARPVKTSGARQEGDRSPDRAVDGNTTDRYGSAWFARGWPCWLEVDFGKPAEIDAAQAFFYWDGKRYYQYTLDASLDGKEWQTVADMSKNTKPSTSKGRMHRFDPVRARYVRINILKNSSNPSVHLVELKVYAAGKAPKPRPKPKPDAEGFVSLFNGKDLTGWVGSTKGYVAENGNLVCLKKGGGNVYTEDEYSDFVFRFEFKLTPGGNNGIGIRVPMRGGASSAGMEIQVLDNTAEKYKKLKPYQYHGSIYGVVPAKRGHLKPVGEWNSEEIVANGRRIKVVLNGTTIVDADIDKASTTKTMDGKAHPGLKRTSGHICFCGHGSRVEFRNVRIKDLGAPAGGD